MFLFFCIILLLNRTRCVIRAIHTKGVFGFSWWGSRRFGWTGV